MSLRVVLRHLRELGHQSIAMYSQVGEVEACEILHTLSTVLGRVLHNHVPTSEDEASHAKHSQVSGISWRSLA